ncbi:Malate dehydrogenase, mitochondrial [Seminavis robusta]|uniref:Malate dehydrogenase n=1 Tax=Seminavis robusta TaxID=568900 RepID=A0A9N8HSU0_9STRA|nr:Malate dehydrogenase, mitochondrial [Seminavis robusta]|eukprot:Sro1489_g277010.1 Malate dehydrogenase, mitochondrial (280) ;mRNA; r:26602-27895
MFASASRATVSIATKMSKASFSSTTAAASKKVAVLGAAGGIGQPLSMLLKLVSCAGDWSWSLAPRAMMDCRGFDDADVVVLRGVPAGVVTNAGIVKGLVESCAEYCPGAVLAIISNPVNSTVPIAAEVLKARGVYDPKKLCGVTTLDVCRANTQVPGFMDAVDEKKMDALTVRTQFGGDEVVKAKAGAGSATLSMAYAGYVFTENVLRAMDGEEITQCAFVESTLTDAPYFASPCKFGPDGVTEVLGYGELTAYEKGWFDKMLPDLKKQIQKGIDFANN